MFFGLGKGGSLVLEIDRLLSSLSLLSLVSFITGNPENTLEIIRRCIVILGKLPSRWRQ